MHMGIPQQCMAPQARLRRRLQQHDISRWSDKQKQARKRKPDRRAQEAKHIGGQQRNEAQ